jgi:hypothetical protein
VRGNEIADGLARDGEGRSFLGPEPVLGVSRRDIQNRHSRWLYSQHCSSWRAPSNNLRQARELISGPSLGNRAKFLSFNRTQSRVVTGFLTGNNTLRMYLFLKGQTNSPVCKGCGVKEEISAHVLCEWEACASLRHIYIYIYISGFLLLGTREYQQHMSRGHLRLWQSRSALLIMIWGTKGSSIRPRSIGAVRSRTLIQSISQSIKICTPVLHIL